jgi:hypothetical protein
MWKKKDQGACPVSARNSDDHGWKSRRIAVVWDTSADLKYRTKNLQGRQTRRKNSKRRKISSSRKKREPAMRNGTMDNNTSQEFSRRGKGCDMDDNGNSGEAL